MTVSPGSEMDPIWRPATWEQLVASVDMLRSAMNACPDDLWDDREQKPEFWYLVFHTLFWLDLYLSPSVGGFTPPAPFTLDELDENGLMPERPYSKSELSAYFDHCRAKCATVIGSMSDEQAQQRCGFPWLECTVGEMHAYNMRHVQHGVGQLHVILRQKTGSAPPRWVTRASKGIAR